MLFGQEECIRWGSRSPKWKMQFWGCPVRPIEKHRNVSSTKSTVALLPLFGNNVGKRINQSSMTAGSQRDHSALNNDKTCDAAFCHKFFDFCFPQTCSDDGVGRQFAEVAVLPVVDVLARSVVAQQFVVVTAAIARPLGVVASVRVLPHRRVPHERYVSADCTPHKSPLTHNQPTTV